MDVDYGGGSSLLVMVGIGRVFLGLALLVLVTAWISGVRGGPVFGLSQQHLLGDATVMALLGIGAMVDAFWHARNR
ncbi:hypothetical protein MQH10_00165 [Phenylobacterium aquaticum]|nr:hypothetical protein [Phenylobacterium aquaticum]